MTKKQNGQNGQNGQNEHNGQTGQNWQNEHNGQTGEPLVYTNQHKPTQTNTNQHKPNTKWIFDVLSQTLRR